MAATLPSPDLDEYQDFLLAKIPRAEARGFEPLSAPHESLFGHQRDIAGWAVRGGQRAVFGAFGTGKTREHLQVAIWVTEKEVGKKYLITCPLGVRHVFTLEDGPAMGLAPVFCRTDAEIDDTDAKIIITNYHAVVDGRVTIDSRFAGAGLDEGSVLRSFGSKTYQEFRSILKDVLYKFVFTATPSPNRYKELIHYADVLGIMDSGQALTRFFKRDPKKAGNLTLHPHMEEKFWLWVSSWACFIQKPSDLGYSDEAYELPPLKVHYHIVPVDHHKAWAQEDGFGQKQLIADQSSGVKEVAGVKRETMLGRVLMAKRIMEGEWSEEGLAQRHKGTKKGKEKGSEQSPCHPATPSPCLADSQLPLAPRDRHWLLWHELEDERRLIEKLVPEARTAYGSQDLDKREDLIVGFQRGEYRILATKPSIAGSGCNFQRHCADAIFLGSTYKFNDFIQAVHRIQRFQQKRPVNIHIIYSESEAPVIQVLKRKWREHNELVARMSALLKKYGLSLEAMKLTRTLGCNRVEVAGERYRVIRNDCVRELRSWPANSVHGIITSIPFGKKYEYSETVEDFGHNATNEAFWGQMEFLIPELLRVTMPGRICCVHVKDEIQFANVTGWTRPTVEPVSDDTSRAFRKHGWKFFGRIVIETDVVRENAQTYRLSYTKKCEDGTMCGAGMPEYILLFFKLPTDLSVGYADTRVNRTKESYPLARWQIDADGIWKSDGNRLLDPDHMLHLPHDAIGRLWREHAQTHGYNYDAHVAVGTALEKKGKLSKEYSLFPPISQHPDIWTDISRIDTLNSDQWRQGEESHVCPLQKDVVRRLIDRFTKPDEIVLDPFMGIGTVPSIAVRMARIGQGIELNERYWKFAAGYCEAAEAERNVPDLFDWMKTADPKS